MQFIRRLCALMCILLFFIPAVCAEDTFSRYQADIGYGFSVLDMLPEAPDDLAEHLHRPELVIPRRGYIIRVTEVLADPYHFYANVEVELTAPEGVLRPMLCTVETERYYDDYAALGMPAWFVSVDFASEVDMFPTQYALGLDASERRMNCLEAWSLSPKGDPPTVDTRLPVTFTVTVAHFDGRETHSESTQFTLDCPILGATDWARVRCDDATLAELHRWNLPAPDCLFVQTPIDLSCFVRGIAPLDPAQPLHAYFGLFALRDGGWLTPGMDLGRFPEELYLFLYRSDEPHRPIMRWPAVREGNAYMIYGDRSTTLTP